jgi:acyl-CoA thioester hydrolase
MPTRYTRPFTIRHYECDAYGHLNNVNYVRFMQETAIGACADVGWTLGKFAQHNTHWVIRETRIEYLQPVYFDETITLSTWVSDFRKVRSLRHYEFHRADGTLVARADTDWVYMDVTSQRPTLIPQDMIDLFYPEGDAPSIARDKFPVAPPPPNEVFTNHRRVEWRDIDSLGHVNNTSYFSYIEDTGFRVGTHFGWSGTRMQDLRMAIVVRNLHVQYVQSALLDDEITIDTYLSDLKRVMGYRHYIIRRTHDQALLAQARALFVFINLDTLQPIRPPQAMLDDFAGNIIR